MFIHGHNDMEDLYKMEKKELRRYITIAVLAVLVCLTVQYFGVVAGFLGFALNAVKPMFIGLVIAYIFNILMTTFEKKYFPNSQKKFVRVTRRPFCLAFSFLIILAVLALILYIVIPELGNAFSVLYTEIPPKFLELQKYAVDTLNEFPEIQEKIKSIQFDWAAIISKTSGFLTSGVAGILSSAFDFIGGITVSITNLCLGVVFAMYTLIRKDKLRTDAKRILTVFVSKEKNAKLTHVLHIANDTFRSFFIGQFVDALVLGSMCFIGMTLLRLPYAAMSAALVGVTALIPIVGAFIGAGISAFIILTENPTQALIFIIFLICIQQLEGNFVYPKVVGESVGLPGIWVLAAVTAGGGLLGIVGMIIFVPITAVAYKLSFEKLEAKERRIAEQSAPNKNNNKNKNRRRKPNRKPPQNSGSQQSQQAQN